MSVMLIGKARATQDLEHLTEPPDLVEADQGAGERRKRHVDVDTALIPDGQAVASEPSEGALDNPAVSTEVGAALDPTACNTRGDAAGAALLAAAVF